MVYYTCGVCNQRVERDVLVYTAHTEVHIVDEIKKKHPNWTEKDGLCAKCLEYYRNAKGGRS